MSDFTGRVFVTYVGSVNGGGPPEGEATIGDLIQTGPLGIGQLLVLHRLLKATGSLPRTE